MAEDAPEPKPKWWPVDHACRFCGGRIMARQGGERRCFNCTASTMTGVVKDICGCGLAAAPGRYPFRCERNPAPGPANPAEIIIGRTTSPAASGGPIPRRESRA